MDGNTVTWTDATKWVWQPIEVVAAAPGLPGWVLPAAGLAGGVLAGAALGIGGWRVVSRRWAEDGSADADESEEFDDGEAADPGERSASAGQRVDVEPKEGHS